MVHFGTYCNGPLRTFRSEASWIWCGRKGKCPSPMGTHQVHYRNNPLHDRFLAPLKSAAAVSSFSIHSVLTSNLRCHCMYISTLAVAGALSFPLSLSMLKVALQSKGESSASAREILQRLVENGGVVALYRGWVPDVCCVCVCVCGSNVARLHCDSRRRVCVYVSVCLCLCLCTCECVCVQKSTKAACMFSLPTLLFHLGTVSFPLSFLLRLPCPPDQ